MATSLISYTSEELINKIGIEQMSNIIKRKSWYSRAILKIVSEMSLYKLYKVFNANRVYAKRSTLVDIIKFELLVKRMKRRM